MQRFRSIFQLKCKMWFVVIGAVLPASLMAASVLISWQPNTESDLAGYKIYYGKASRSYPAVIDVGNVIEYQVDGLNSSTTYYFAVTAYDVNNNQSDYSDEVIYTIEDTEPPEIISVICDQVDRVKIFFSEELDSISAVQIGNYHITNGIIVQSVELQTDLRTVYLNTIQHSLGDYILTVNNIQDKAAIPNTILSNTEVTYPWTGGDVTPPVVEKTELYRRDFLAITFSEPLEQNSALTKSNYSISSSSSSSINIISIGIENNFSTVYLTTDPHDPGWYTITINNIIDVSNNTIVPNTQKDYEWVPEDINPPVIISLSLKNSMELKLEFSESLDSTTAVDTSNYTIEPNMRVNSAEINSDKTIVTLKTEEHNEGYYTITVRGVGDHNDPPNLITPVELEYSYTLPDIFPPVLETAVLQDDDYLELTFSEPLDTSSALNENNYFIEPHVDVKKANLDVSKKIVYLHAASHPAGNYRIYVTNVKDEADNAIVSGSYIDYVYDQPDVSPPQLLQTILHGSDILELIFSESLDQISSSDINNYSIFPSVEIKSALLVGDSLNIVYLTTSNHIQGQSYTVTVSGIIDQSEYRNTIPAGTTVNYDFPINDTTPPRLENATLDGNLFLILDFSEMLNQASVEDTTNYTIEPVLKVKKATLDASLKRVFLKTEEHQPGTDYKIIVNGIKDLAEPANIIIDGNNVKTYTCTANDRTAPYIRRVEIRTGGTTLELWFNEPLDPVSARDKNNYRIDNVYNDVSIIDIGLSTSEMEVNLVTTHHEPGTYTLTVQGIKDQAKDPNTMQSESKGYTYTPPDTFPPALVNATMKSNTIIELEFSEHLSKSSVVDTSHYKISNGITIESVFYDGSKVHLVTSQHLYQGNYTVTVNGIQDWFNNTISQNTEKEYTYYVVDNKPPEISSADLRNESRLLVTFSEPLDQKTAEDKNNYTINNNVDIISVYFYTTDEQVMLETSPHAAGSYKITISNIKDTSANEIIKYSQKEYVWSPLDTIGPELINASLTQNYQLKLQFNESIGGDEFMDINNYSIVPNVKIHNTILDHKYPNVIWLITAPHDAGNYKIEVSNIKDLAFEPNIIGSKNKAEYSYVPPDTIPPSLISILSKSPMSLLLVFDEVLSRSSAENIENYTIEPDIIVTYAWLNNNHTEVLLETSKHETGIQYTINIEGITDRATIPNTLIQSITKTYSYEPDDAIPPKLISVKLHGVNLVELVFNEELDQSLAVEKGNYRIEPNVEVLYASLDDTTRKTVYLSTTYHKPLFGSQYKVYVQNLKDKAQPQNTIDPDTWKEYPGPGLILDKSPPEVAMVDPISESQLDIVFNEPINKTTAEDENNYSIEDSINVQSALIDSNSVRVHLRTSFHELGHSYRIYVNNIQDQADEPNILSKIEPIIYLLAKSAAVSNINQNQYELKTFSISNSNSSYMDRSYKITQVPDVLEGAIQILTSNNDKTSTGNNFLTFELSGEATIYVGYDKRISKIPDWLSTWKSTGDQIVNSRPDVFRVYSRESKAGRVTLGGNNGSSDDNMYLVFIVPHNASRSVLSNLNKVSYQLQHISVGDAYYIDRDYTIAFIPDSLKGLLWIRTANDDKTNRDTDFLNFTLNQKSLVYIAYDEGIQSLPKWLIDWEKIDDQIIDSRGKKFDVFYDTLAAGNVKLGGNCGSANENNNMYFVLIKPLELDNYISEIPGYFSLIQNYPNPFNPKTTIPFEIHKTGHVTLSIFNILGQTVKVLLDDDLQAGYKGEVVWDGKDQNETTVASGVYLFRIQQDNFAKTRRMLLIR